MTPGFFWAETDKSQECGLAPQDSTQGLVPGMHRVNNSIFEFSALRGLECQPCKGSEEIVEVNCLVSKWGN